MMLTIGEGRGEGRVQGFGVETTGFHGAGHAIETMDVISQAP